MRLGLLADIHEAVEPLRAALDELRTRKVDSFVMLGDVLDHGERVDETVELLRALPGVGVWGNHDFGLCGEVQPSVRDRFSRPVLDYFARLRPSVTVEGVRFQHIDPHLDPNQLADLWQFPTATERIAGFARCHDVKVFVGHLHGWAIFTTDGQIPWEANEEFRYRVTQRYLTVVHAVMDGWCAVFDSATDSLIPIRVA